MKRSAMEITIAATRRHRAPSDIKKKSGTAHTCSHILGFCDRARRVLSHVVDRTHLPRAGYLHLGYYPIAAAIIVLVIVLYLQRTFAEDFARKWGDE